MEHTIENGMMVHKVGDGQEYAHNQLARCDRCPPLPQSVDGGMWKVSASFTNPATGVLEQHEVTSTPDVVAAWLRALADRAAPPRPVLRQEGYQQKRGLDALPKARH